MVSKITKIEDFIEKNGFLLIVGWSNVKKLYPNQKITEKSISNNIFWTFSEKEKRNDYERDIVEFHKKCMDNFKSKFIYYFLNPFELKYGGIKKIIKKIESSNNKVGYFNGRHFFITIDNIILGIDMDFIDLLKISKDKIILWLKSKKTNFIENTNILNYDDYVKNNEYLIPPIEKEKYEKEFITGYILNP